MSIRVAAVSANFGRDLEADYATIADLVGQARLRGIQLLALPEAALGGYLPSLGNHGDTIRTTRRSLPPALSLHGPELARVAEIAGDVMVATGFCELDDDGATRYNAAALLDGSGVISSYRKVHQPLGENLSYQAGDSYRAVDTRFGRIALQICYDKAFPEAARSQALDGAEIIISLSAWPASRTNRAPRVEDDRWTFRYNLFDQARALDNQVFWIASNQTGQFGSLTYVGNAKIVDPGGAILATTGVGPGLAVADIDTEATFRAMRRGMYHLRDRRPDAYDLDTTEVPEYA